MRTEGSGAVFWARYFAVLTLGFYLGMLLVIAVVGEAAFNAAVPSPERALFGAPGAVAAVWAWCVL